MTIFLRWYIASLWLVYYITGVLYLLIFCIYFTQSPNSPPIWQPPICSLHPWVYFHFILFISFIVFLDFTYTWGHEVFIFPFWLISFSIIPSRSIHVVPSDKISFNGWVIFHYIYIYLCVCVCVCVCVYHISHLLYPFIYLWTLGLLSYLGYYK